MKKNLKVSRDQNLLNKVVLIDGQAGCGKTLLTSLVSSFDRVEIFNYAPEIENICILEHLNKITKDASETMVKIQMDLCLYETMMSRRINFRYYDLSSAFSSGKFIEYFKRLFEKGDASIPQKLIDNKPILNYAVHNLLSFSQPLFRALEKKFTIVEVVRHPLYMVIQNTINHKNMKKKNGSARQFRVYLKNKEREFPYQFNSKEKIYRELNACEKSIYDIDFFTNRTEKFKLNLSSLQKKSILTIPFENFVLNPNSYLKSITSLLKSKTTNKTLKLLKKHKVPRKKISDGISLEVYKRYGWEPSIKGFSERDELNKRRDFVIKQGVRKKYLDLLDKHSAEYEKKYLKGTI
jgi:hypothetical protein